MLKTSRTVTLGPVRLHRQNLFTPFSHHGNDEEAKFNCTLLIPKADPNFKLAIDTAINAAADEAIQTKWNGTAPVPLITPVHDGDGVRPNGESYAPECAGHYVMTANSKEKPEVVDFDLNPIVNVQEIYGGIWVYVSITFFAYMRNGKKGIGCGLGPVMKLRDDERLDGKVTASRAFASIVKPSTQVGTYTNNELPKSA